MPKKLDYNTRRRQETAKKMQQVVSWRKRGPEWTFSRIAEKMGCTASYAASLFQKAQRTKLNAAAR